MSKTDTKVRDNCGESKPERREPVQVHEYERTKESLQKATKDFRVSQLPTFPKLVR